MVHQLRINADEEYVALVTGATGFVGRHLVHRLVQKGWRVHIVIRPNSQPPNSEEFSRVIRYVCEGGTSDVVRCVAQSKPHVVFHLAAVTRSQHAISDIEPLVASNVLFGCQLLEAMSANNVKYLVNTGTYWQHYNNEGYNPTCLYAATKQAFESVLEYYVQAFGISAVTLKLFDTYGPDDSRSKLLPLLGRASLTGEVLDMSAGEQLIDLVHIHDVVEAYLIAAHRLIEGAVHLHESYAVSSGKALPLKELVCLYGKVLGKAIPVNWGARAYRNREVMVPWNEGRAIPGWVPTIALEDGLKREGLTSSV